MAPGLVTDFTGASFVNQRTGGDTARDFAHACNIDFVAETRGGWNLNASDAGLCFDGLADHLLRGLAGLRADKPGKVFNLGG